MIRVPLVTSSCPQPSVQASPYCCLFLNPLNAAPPESVNGREGERMAEKRPQGPWNPSFALRTSQGLGTSPSLFHCTTSLKQHPSGTSLMVQSLKVCLLIDMGSIPGLGTKMPHATGQLHPCTTTRDPVCHNKGAMCCN